MPTVGGDDDVSAALKFHVRGKPDLQAHRSWRGKRHFSQMHKRERGERDECQGQGGGP
jgi:hypothetical protein